MASVHTIFGFVLFSLSFFGVQCTKMSLIGGGTSSMQNFFNDNLPKLNNKHNVYITYDATNSLTGKAKFIQKSIHFACSHVPFSHVEDTQIKEIKYTLPFSLETISVFVNIPGYELSKIYLSRETTALIFSGKITKWADPRIKKENPNLKIPSHESIFVVHASDSSGATLALTKWLNKDKKTWSLGEGEAINWPKQQNFIRAQENMQVASAMKGTPYSIGYLGTRLGLGLKENLNEVYLKNNFGTFVKASNLAVSSFIPNTVPRSIDSWVKFSDAIIDSNGKQSYPIVAVNYLISRKNLVFMATTGGLLKAFLRYLMSSEGQGIATEHYFTKLPAEILSQNLKAIETLVLAPGVSVPF